MDQKKILIVDDDAVILNGLSSKLKANGYHVFTAADGSEAVSTVRREKPHLILLDILFPPDVAHGGGLAWDGFTIVQWLRRIDEVKDIPIIVITGAEPEKYQARALATGAVAFFHKPIDGDALLNTIRQTLGERPPGS